VRPANDTGVATWMMGFERIRGRPVSLALGGWVLSLGLGLAAAGLLFEMGANENA